MHHIKEPESINAKIINDSFRRKTWNNLSDLLYGIEDKIDKQIPKKLKDKIINELELPFSIEADMQIFIHIKQMSTIQNEN